MRRVAKRAAAAITASSPGVSGAFVELDDRYQQVFIDLLNSEVQRRREQVMAATSTVLPPIVVGHSRSARESQQRSTAPEGAAWAVQSPEEPQEGPLPQWQVPALQEDMPRRARAGTLLDALPRILQQPPPLPQEAPAQPAARGTLQPQPPAQPLPRMLQQLQDAGPRRSRARMAMRSGRQRDSAVPEGGRLPEERDADGLEEGSELGDGGGGMSPQSSQRVGGGMMSPQGSLRVGGARPGRGSYIAVPPKYASRTSNGGADGGEDSDEDGSSCGMARANSSGGASQSGIRSSPEVLAQVGASSAKPSAEARARNRAQAPPKRRVQLLADPDDGFHTPPPPPAFGGPGLFGDIPVRIDGLLDPVEVSRRTSLMALRRMSETLKLVRTEGTAAAATLSKKMVDSCAEVFMKLQDDGEIHRDLLPRALGLLGFVNADPNWVSEAFSSVSRWTTIPLTSFVSFVEAYAKMQRAAYVQAFIECDESGAGALDIGTISVLLHKLGEEPMQHVLSELFDEVDRSGTGFLDVEGLERLIEIMRRREGFTRQEYETFVHAFRMHTRPGFIEITTQQFLSLVVYLGFGGEPTSIHEVLEQAGVEDSGLLNEREFLVCMRLLRKRQLAMVQAAIEACDMDGNGDISFEELKLTFETLGYMPDDDAIAEAARDAGVRLNGSLDLGDFWRLLQVFRQREGLTSSETEGLRQAFKIHDKDGSGELGAVEVGMALRWLGYVVTFEQVQDLISQVDVNNSGKLDLPEFRKLVRTCQDCTLTRAREAFLERLKDQDASSLSVEDVVELLDTLGYINRDDPLSPFLQALTDPVDLADFLRAAHRHIRAFRQAFRASRGFSAKDLLEFRASFQRYDADGSGDISKKELVLLIQHTFPTLAHNKDRRPELERLIQEVDEDGSGSVSFEEYLHLMATLREMNDRQRLARERQVVAECGFSPEEVREFRKLFLASDTDGDETLALGEAMGMMEHICPLGTKNAGQFKEIFCSVAHAADEDGEGDEMATFPEFLKLMRTLMDVNFAGIMDRIGSKGVSAGASTAVRPSTATAAILGGQRGQRG